MAPKGTGRLVSRGLRDFFSGPAGRLRARLKKAVRDEEDLFWLLAFPDLLGIPSPASYYNLELLVLLGAEMEEWALRMEHPGLRSDRRLRALGLS